MPDTTTDQTGENTETPEGETPAEETTETGSTDEGAETPNESESETPPEGDDEDNDDEDGKELDLDGAKKALSKVRKSEAKYRTRLREIEAKLEGAKTPEQVDELLAQVRKDSADEARDLLVENVAIKAGVPEALWDRLKGDTREELETDAKSLAALLPTEQSDDPDLRGGLDPEDEPGDDVAAMRKAMDAQRRRR